MITKIYRISRWVLCAALITCQVALFTSCEDEPDKYEISDGTPTIRYIRPVNIESADSILSGAFMDNNICIVGENLRSITKMFFNDQEAKLVPSLITDNTMIVTVPSQIPGEVQQDLHGEQRQRHHHLRLQGAGTRSFYQQHEQRMGQGR